MSDFVFPYLEWYDVSSLIRSSPLVEEAFRMRNYWRTLFKRSLDGRESRLNVVLTLVEIDAETIRNSDDAQLFHKLGRTLAENLLNWKALFSQDSLPRSTTYSLKGDCLEREEDLYDEKGLS